MKIFRWHVSRRFEDFHPDDPVELDLVITPATPGGTEPLMQVLKLPPSEVPAEQLDWWESEEDAELQGTTTEHALLEAVTRRNARPNARASDADADLRRIVEDMVLLQLVEDDRVDAYESLWAKLPKDDPWPDVTPLVEAQGARWLDYTQASRRMSSQLYTTLLNQPATRSDETDAS